MIRTKSEMLKEMYNMRRDIQENIKRENQRELAGKQLRYWISKMDMKNDRAYRMVNAWGGVDPELYYEIEPTQYAMCKDGCSDADQFIYRVYYDFDIKMREKRR